MVDGKEFMTGDTKTAMKNLPANIIERVRLTIRKVTWLVSVVLMTVKRKPCSTLVLNLA